MYNRICANIVCGQNIVQLSAGEIHKNWNIIKVINCGFKFVMTGHFKVLIKKKSRWLFDILFTSITL